MFVLFLLGLVTYIPGELVMKNGKVLVYKGEYKLEGQWIKFTSATDEALSLPAKMVDFEKTEARQAQALSDKLAKERYTEKKGSFAELVQDTFARDISIDKDVLDTHTGKAPTYTSSSESVFGEDDHDYIVRIDDEDEYEDSWKYAPGSKPSKSNDGYKGKDSSAPRMAEDSYEAQARARLEERFRSRYASLKRRKAAAMARLDRAKDYTASATAADRASRRENRVSVASKSHVQEYTDRGENNATSEIERINQEIRNLELEALSAGVFL